MNAKEFYNKWIVKHPDPYALLTGKPFVDEFIKKSLIGFAEAYHKSKVGAISDEILEVIDMYDSLVEIKEGSPSDLIHCILPEHYKDLAEDIIKLLKQ